MITARRAADLHGHGDRGAQPQRYADQVVLQPGCWMHGASGLGDRRVVADGAGTWQPAGSRPVVLCRVAQSRCLSERGVEVVPEVVDVFAADAQAQEPGGDVFLSGLFG